MDTKDPQPNCRNNSFLVGHFLLDLSDDATLAEMARSRTF